MKSQQNIFFQLENAKGKKKEIDCLESRGNIIKDKQKMLTGIRELYCKLYKGNNTEAGFKEYISDIKLNVLNEEDAHLCEGKITENKCWEALNKSPGSDGLSVEFINASGGISNIW